MKATLEHLLVAALVMLLIGILITGFVVVHQVRESRDVGEEQSLPIDGSGKVRINISPRSTITDGNESQGVGEVS